MFFNTPPSFCLDQITVVLHTAGIPLFPRRLLNMLFENCSITCFPIYFLCDPQSCSKPPLVSQRYNLGFNLLNDEFSFINSRFMLNSCEV